MELSNLAATYFGRDIASFRRYLKSENKSENTVRIYTDGAERFANWLAVWPGSDDVATAESWDEVTRHHIQEWIAALLEGGAAAGYANNQYRAVQQFWRWRTEVEVEEGVEPLNPMARLRPPKVPEQPVDILREPQLAALIKSCKGTTFIDRRDLAILLVFMDTGIRRAEMAGLRIDDVDLDLREIQIMGKGRRRRTVVIGHATTVALDRYLRLRDRERLADRDELWLAEKGRGVLTYSGVKLMLRRRGEAIGLHLYPHLLRHTWAHHSKKNMSEEELMRLAGWRSRQMVDRYAASTADERAREAGKRRPLSDSL